MKTKKRLYIVGALCAVLLGLFALLFTVQQQDATTASAATSHSNVCTIQGRVELAGGNASSISVSENFTVTMESETASGTSTLAMNAKLSWTYVIIKVDIKNSVRENISFNLMKDGEEYQKNALSGKTSMTLFSGNLPDGNYSMYYKFSIAKGVNFYSGLNYVFHFTIDTTAPKNELKAGGVVISNGSSTNKNISYSASDANFRYLYYKKPNASSFSTTTDTVYNVDATAANSGWWEFYATDTLGHASEKVKLYLDLIPPTLSCGSGASFGGTVGKKFTVTATDGSGTAKLYVKFESEEWFSTGSTYTVPETERNGRYYFYGEDGNGNRSETSWIVLSTEDPSGSLIKSDSDNSVSFVWNNQYWSATLDGANYTEGRMISSEGEHEIILSNNALKKKNYTFKIDHYYKVVGQTAATCLDNGVKNYECSQCGDAYEEIIYTSGHRYSISSTPSSCTESEHITYSCSACGASYETEGAYPTGHSYISTITQEPTCTVDGQRKIACEKCGDEYFEVIKATGHSYGIAEVETKNGRTIRTYTCSQCGGQYKQDLGKQYEEVSNYMEYLVLQYEPYMWWVFLAAAGVWSIALGVMIIIAQKNEDKEKAKKMLVNYVIGLVVIAIILVACPFLMRGIATLIS